MQQDKEFDTIFKKAIRIISLAPQFEKGLFLKLKKYGYEESIIRNVISKLKELNYINDYENAKDYAKTLFTKKGYSEAIVLNKMREKGIDKGLIDSILKELKENISEKEILLKFIQKNRAKFHKYLKNNREKDIINTFYKYGFKIENYESLLKLVKENIDS